MGKITLSLAMLLLLTKERPETASLQEEEEGTCGAKELKKNLVDIKTVLASKVQKLWFFSLF